MIKSFAVISLFLKSNEAIEVVGCSNTMVVLEITMTCDGDLVALGYVLMLKDAICVQRAEHAIVHEA